eukprot:gene1323-15719_t
MGLPTENAQYLILALVAYSGIPIRTTLDNSTTLQYAGLIHQLTAKARSTVRDIDPQYEELKMSPIFMNGGLDSPLGTCMFMDDRGKTHVAMELPIPMNHQNVISMF